MRGVPDILHPLPILCPSCAPGSWPVGKAWRGNLGLTAGDQKEGISSPSTFLWGPLRHQKIATIRGSSAPSGSSSLVYSAPSGLGWEGSLLFLAPGSCTTPCGFLTPCSHLCKHSLLVNSPRIIQFEGVPSFLPRQTLPSDHVVRGPKICKENRRMEKRIRE